MTPREIRRETELCFVYYNFSIDKYFICSILEENHLYNSMVKKQKKLFEGTYKECLQFVEEEYKPIKK
jgi:hypothetical protein